jgi:hypothetical protein
MNVQQCTIIFSSAALLLILAESSFAFSITGPRTGRSVNKPFDNGSITVETIDLEELSPPRKNSDFMTLLRRDFRKSQGWFFNRSNRNLVNNLIVTDYKPCLLELECTKNISKPGQVFITNLLGAALALEYRPTRFENNLPGDFDWIQRIFTNDSNGPQNPGNTETYLDNGGFSTPFYPGIAGMLPGQTTPTVVFLDAPERLDYKREIFWYAELYLTKSFRNPNTNRNTVTVFNGVKWGWTSKFTPCVPRAPVQ